ncbi:hypothetical protein [Brevundimonas sp.]|uniref:type I pantothenate kinase n=1 Tax=Brevundimonas sp. TaxID=1871086 RepID=UPI0025DF395B|nr:hypothetical protein [Brevundimonas sp.]
MDWTDQIVAEIETRRTRERDRAFVVGIAGGVASGKSRIAGELAGGLRARGLAVEVVGTDGFLLPNAELAERGLMDRKGFPDTYDWLALSALMRTLRAGDPRLSVPTYSHETYDVDGTRTFDRPDVLILEGLVALDARVEPLDLGLYVEAGEEQLMAWYTERFLGLGRQHAPRLADRLRAVGGDPNALAADIWARINGPNLRDHVAPTRARADFVLAKGSDHAIRVITPA